jgi:hypothetical protein
LYSYFAPRTMAVQRKVFENTPSYQIGIVMRLHDMEREYVTTKDPSEKAALASIILHDADDVPADVQLPPDLQSFVSSLRINQGLN